MLAAALVLAPAALATHHTAARTHHLSGVVVSINASHHTLKLRLRHGSSHHGKAASARIAEAGSGTVVVSCAHATVKGPDGAVAVGDRVSVTTNGLLGGTVVADSIAVIGRPNGGDAGKGAAVPGTVVSVDSSSDTLTLATGAGSGQDSGGSNNSGGDDNQPQAQDSSVATLTVSVLPSTILAIGDANGDNQITLDDVSAGDHLVVFTADATADPIVALGILDASQPGANCHEGDSPHQGSSGGDSGKPAYQGFNGTVAALQPPNALAVTVAGDGPLAGQTVTVDVTATTHYKGVNAYAAIAVGDQVRVYTQSLSQQPVVAVFIGDGPVGSDGGSPTQAATGATRFGGTVTDVRGDGLTITVTSDGPLNGHSVIVAVPAATTFEGVQSLD